MQSAGFVAKSLILHSIFLVQKFPAKITIGVKCVTGSVQIAEGIEKLTNHDAWVWFWILFSAVKGHNIESSHQIIAVVVVQN